MQTTNFTFQPENGFVIEAEITWAFDGYSGIGSYEFWGTPGFDKGHPEFELVSIEITSATDADGNDIDFEQNTPEVIAMVNDWKSSIQNLAVAPDEVEC